MGIRQLQLRDVYKRQRMPIMNGLELAKTCREKYGRIPLFIFLTSYEEFQLIKEATTYEAVDYLIKLEPVSYTHLDVYKRQVPA